MKHKHEEYLQWFEYERDIGDIVECPRCHRYVAWDEYVDLAMCDECFREIAKEDIEKGII